MQKIYTVVRRTIFSLQCFLNTKAFSLYANKRVGAIPATIASSIVGFDIEKES
ncbi:DUF3173 family protein [Streptococcus caprae]|uniref:DUF3173 family protein n=1 Tax=Streptococcus caprae TaxID=1640501 RepID=A0ABV8CVQ8_9STRE